MEKMEILRIVIEVVAMILVAFLASKTFKFKDALTTLINAAKDGKVTEEEFQNIVDDIKKDLARIQVIEL